MRNALTGLRLPSLFCLLILIPPDAASAQSGGPPPAGTGSIGALTLKEALSLALHESPDLASFAWQGRAAEARALQAGARPNPRASFTAENVGWDEPGFSNAELTLSLGQIVELGGKRGARVDAARAEGASVALEYDALKLEVMAEVTRRFVEGLAADRLYALQSQAEKIADEVRSTIALKVRAGAVSPAEEARAELELQSVRLRRQDADQERALARVRLSSLWGDSAPRFAELAGNLDTLVALPPREELVLRLEESPEFARLQSDVASSRMRVELAQSGRVPDLEIEAGVRRFEESGDNTFVAGISAPLPLFDRNEGTLSEAEADLSRGESEVARGRVLRTRALAESYALVARAQARVETLRRDILPTAERVFHEIRTGYERGRFGYVDLLEARRALTEARREEIDSLLRYHLAVTDAELLLGGPLNRTPSEEDSSR